MVKVIKMNNKSTEEYHSGKSYPILIEVEDDYWTCHYGNIEWVHINEKSS